MRIQVSESFTFEAAHYLEGLGRDNSTVHGHSHKVIITIEGDTDNMRKPWLLEQSKFRKVFKPIIKKLDHSLLNDHMDETTAEGIARYIFDEIDYIEKPKKNIWLHSVEVSKVGMSAKVFND